jgi:hypothetical protein
MTFDKILNALSILNIVVGGLMVALSLTFAFYYPAILIYAVIGTGFIVIGICFGLLAKAHK